MRERDIFDAALAIADPAARSAYLDKVSAGNPELRQHLDDLLALHGQLGSFLEAPAPSLVATVDDRVRERPGTGIGPYKLLEEIGEGGMGLVFVAEQQEPIKRRVALKIIKPGMDSRQVIARFEAERQALALMDHPHIAKVHDGGTTPEGRPYFVMELVKGTSITDYSDTHRLTNRQRLVLFLAVCHAVQHAHQKGIIHRDLKPSNVLVEVHDVQPVVKVIDFGVAKAIGQQLTDKTVYTTVAQMVGTPLYMSPEQAGLSSLDVDTRSDVYSLGVLLYELLTGTTPFDREQFKKAGDDEMRRIVREEEPPRPSTRLSTIEQAELSTLAERRGQEPRRLSQQLRGELDWIVMKALEKDRNRRYESASAFAADVQCYLGDEPLQACPPSKLYRLRKFARRHKAGLGIVLSAAVCTLLSIAMIGASLGWIFGKETARRGKAAESFDEAVQRGITFIQQEKWLEAKAAAQRAADLLVSASDDLVRKQCLEQMERDLKMADRLEQIRLEKVGRKTDDGFEFRTDTMAYEEAFRDYGIDITELDVAETVGRIRSRRIWVELASALDEWADVYRDAGIILGMTVALARTARNRPALNSKELLGLARAVDPDELRNRLGDALERGDAEVLKKVAASEWITRLPSSCLILLAKALVRTGAVKPAVVVLMEGQRRDPSNFWINYELAEVLAKLDPAHIEEVVRFLTAAVALRPQIPGAHVKLGLALHQKGQLDDAIREYHEALRLENDIPVALRALWAAFADQGRLNEAIQEYTESLRFKEYRPEAYLIFGDFLLQQGRFKEALKIFRRGLELGGSNDAASYNFFYLRSTFRNILDWGRSNLPRSYLPAQEVLRKTEQLVELDERLSAVLAGEARPRDCVEQATLAELCVLPCKKHYIASVRFFREAFKEEPKLADDLDKQHRYNAACAAALAGYGQGQDANKLDAQERARLRQQALDWLRADLKAYRQLLEKSAGKAGPAIAQRMQHWLQDTDFAGVRGDESLARLPEEERKDWRKLWQEVAALRQRAEQTPKTTRSARP